MTTTVLTTTGLRISIHQPEFLPWAGFFNKILNCDRFIIFDNVKFKHHYFENRCRVMLNDRPTWITVPVLHKGRGDQRISDVGINNATNWGEKIWKSLRYNYAKAPFWNEHAGFIEDMFVGRHWDRLVDLNMHALLYYCSYLGIRFDYVLGTEVCSDATGAELVLDTCRRLGAGSYLSGRFGKDYLDDAAFADAGITLVYQSYPATPYPRPDGSMSAPLSILDMTLLLGRNALDYIRGEA